MIFSVIFLLLDNLPRKIFWSRRDIFQYNHGHHGGSDLNVNLKSQNSGIISEQ
jgi:hypothetical protein